MPKPSRARRSAGWTIGRLIRDRLARTPVTGLHAVAPPRDQPLTPDQVFHPRHGVTS